MRINRHKALKIISLLLFSALHYGCTHPIEVSGKGVVSDNRSDFSCDHLDTPCKVTVGGAYEAYYVAHPHRGWKFDGWQSCLAPREPNRCEYNINAQTVRDNWFKTMPPLIANFSESDADGDGVLDQLDIRPDDTECTGAGSHTYDSCAFDGLRERRSSVQVLTNDSGLQFIVLSNANEVLRYQTNTQQFMPPIRPDPREHGLIRDAQHSGSLGGLLFNNYDNTIYFVADDSTDATPVELLKIDDESFRLHSFGIVGELIIAHGEYGPDYTYPRQQQERIYNLDGELLSTIDTQLLSYHTYFTHPASGAVYSVARDNETSQYSLRKMLVSAGAEYSAITSVQLISNRPVDRMDLSPDGSLLLLSNGSVYNATDLSLALTIPNTQGHAIWLNNGELLSVQANGEWPARYSLLRSGVDGQPLERINLEREIPNAFIVNGSGAAVFMSPAHTETISSYQPNNDRDGDGIANTEDSFPDDIAASLDTDRDGYPDQWNDGFSAEDSTSNLSLDAFAVDTMCYLDEHGSNGNCDHGARIGPYYPTSVIQDDNGVVYLLPSGSQVMHRWDTESEQYLSSISLKSNKAIDLAVNASNIAYHASSGDVFVAYENGQIRRLSLSSPNTLRDHSQTFGSIRGFTTSENLLFAAHFSTDEIVSLDIASGLEQDRRQWPGSRAPQVLEWNQATRTLYGGATDIQNIGVNAQGQFAVVNGIARDFSNRGTMFSVSGNGQHLVSYLGRINRTADAAIIRDFENSSLIANWLNNSLITVENQENGSELTQWRSDFQTPRFQIQLDYQPLGLLADYGSLIAVYMVNQTLQFDKLSIGDADGDGMPGWWEQQNGLDDNDALDAELDGDLDNLSNLEEYLHETSITEIDTDGDGLIDGDEVNIHDTDPRIADTDGDGLSDGDEVNSYSSSPTLADTDNDRMRDGWEVQNGLNPLDASDAGLDPDADGYSNFEEFTQGTDAQTADHPRIEPWSRQTANNRNNAYFPISLDENGFSRAWAHTYNGRQVHAPTYIGANRSLYRVSLNDDRTDFARNIEIIDADSGAVDMRFPIDADNFEVHRYALDNEQLLLSGYLRGENYTNTKTLNSVNLRSGEYLTMLAAVTDSANYLSAVLATDNSIVEVFSGGPTRAMATNKDSNELLWEFNQIGNTIGAAADADHVYLYHHNLPYGRRLTKIDQVTGEKNAEYTFNPSTYSYTNPDVVTLSETGTLLLFQDSVLRAFDSASLNPIWARDIGRSNHISVGQGKIFLVVNGILFVLDEFTGRTLWVWSPPGGVQLNSNLIAFSSHVFVSGDDKTWAISITTGDAVWDYDNGRNLSYTEGKLIINGYSQVEAIDLSQDQDQDGLPRWWERKHSLDDSDPNDANTDADADGVTNFEEYLAGINPQSSDTDADGISDFDEIQTHNTRPEYADTDNDGLSDGDELTLHFTSPSNADSDADSFSDSAEINEYNSNPNDAASVPVGAITMMQESFEAESLPDGWASSAPAWQTVDFDATDGSRSLLSGTGNRSIESSVFLEGLFAAGTLTFDAKGLESDSRGYLHLFLDGRFVKQLQLGTQWKSSSMEIIEAGDHTIEWRYTNTVYNPSALSIHHAQIDNVRFAPQ